MSDQPSPPPGAAPPPPGAAPPPPQVPPPPPQVPPVGAPPVPPQQQQWMPPVTSGTPPFTAPETGYFVPGSVPSPEQIAPGSALPGSTTQPTRSTTGIIAFFLALVAVVVPTVAGSISAYLIGAGIDLTASEAEVENLSILSPVRDVVLWAEISFWAGTVLGLWALVQGIVALSRGRGRRRGFAIAAIVISALGLIIFVVAVFLFWQLGISSQLQV